MRWSLATQLRLGFAAALVLAIGTCIAAWWMVLNYKAEITSAYETQLRSTVQLAEAQTAFWQLRFGLRELMVGGPEDRQRIVEQENKWYDMIEERLAVYAKAANSQDERTTLTHLRSAYLRYKQARPKFFDLWDAGDRDGAAAWLALAVAPFGDQVARAFETQIGLQRSFVEDDRVASERKVRLALAAVAGITLALLAMLGGGYLYGVRMLRPIRALREQADRTVRQQLGETAAPPGSGNEIRALVNSFQWMSDRLLARTASLRESEARYRQFVERSPDPMLAHSQGRIVLANQAMGQLLGATPESLVGTALLDRIAPARREFVKARMARTIQGLPVPHANSQFLRMDGSTVSVEVAVAPISHQGEPAGLVTARDITQRLQMEEAIRQSRDRLEFLLHSTPAVIWAARVLDPGVNFISENVQGQLGYSADEFLADPRFWASRVHPEDQERVFAALATVDRTDSLAHEYRFRHKDGSWRWMHDELKVVRDAAGAPRELLGYWIDVTERRRAEDALRENEERLRQLLRSTPAVIWASRAEGDYARTFVSENVRSILGYAAEEFIADPHFWVERVHPDDRPGLLARLPREIEASEFAHEYRFRHGDGTWRWIRADATVVRDVAGRPEQIVGYWIDVTERVFIEQDRRRTQARLQLALEAGQLAVWDADTASGLVWLSEQWAELLGEAKRETTSSLGELLTRLHPDDRQPLRNALVAVLKGERAEYAQDSRVGTSGGDWRWIQWRGRVTERTPDGRAARLAGSALDITQHKRLERDIELASRMKSEFMASVTHELRTPLNGVIGFAELLKEEQTGPLNAMQAQFAGDILESGRRLLTLVEGILEMSRLDMAVGQLERVPIEIGLLLEERIALVREAAATRAVALQLDVAPDAGRVDIDQNLLRRMLDALLDNAIKFNRDGGTVAVRARRHGDWLEIAVADSGIGIAHEDRDRLFKPFVQLDAGLARHHGGLGLGLAVAQRLARQHGGTIGIESELGKGSTFTLRLPVSGP